jgi:predicted nucleotidyltransferase
MDAKISVMTRQVKAALEHRFGDGLAAVYVFGSRARGEHAPDSDLDLAVVLRNVRQSLASVDLELLDLLYPIEIEQGLHIQAWALPAESLSAGGEGSGAAKIPPLRGRLAGTIRREGVLI